MREERKEGKRREGEGRRKEGKKEGKEGKNRHFREIVLRNQGISYYSESSGRPTYCRSFSLSNLFPNSLP